MTAGATLRGIAKHVGCGLLLPSVFILNAAFVPEPYSHPLIHAALSPGTLMPFLKDRDLMHALTLAVFGHPTPNDAPIQVVVLVLFWWLVGAAASVVHSRLRRRSDVRQEPPR